MVVVSISETYDLHTEVNKMTLIGIHSPTSNLIKKLYPGFCMNYRMFKIRGVDVALSTAQTLPLGVDQVGLDAGQIRPQDMMNPILYKAVSNDSWSTLEARLKAIDLYGGNASLKGDMASVEDEHVTEIADEHGVYYALLSNRDGWKIAHPQNGLTMKGLKPFMFEKLYDHAINMNPGDDDAPALRINDENTALLRTPIRALSLRGNARPLPAINTTYLTGYNTTSGSLPAALSVANGMGNGNPANIQAETPVLPSCMIGAIVLPPVSATTGILYYRMVCKCYIEFYEPRPITEISSFRGASDIIAPLVYHTDYEEQSKYMDGLTAMADIKNGEIEKIMEGN